MAEIFGVAASALSVAALFNNCVDCFEYIQLGRQFGQDFERSQLKLDIARLRLSRWGAALGINDKAEFSESTQETELAQNTYAILAEIGLLFQSAEKVSKIYKKPSDQQPDLTSQDLTGIAKKVHQRLEEITKKRQKSTNILKKARWALHDGKRLERLINELVDFIGNLEDLTPTQEQQKILATEEVETLDDEPSLVVLKEAASTNDNVLLEAVSTKIGQMSGSNIAKSIEMNDGAKIRVGNEWSAQVLKEGATIEDKTANRANTVKAAGTSTVHIGNSYGGKGIFDN